MEFNISFNEGAKQIYVMSDTHWSCSCRGDLLLSKYSGEGDDTIEILDVDGLWLYDGSIHFTYGDDRCDYPVLNVRFTQDCILETYPQYLLCDTPKGEVERVIYFPYDSERETFTIYIATPTSGGWEVHDDGGHIYFVDNGYLTVVAGSSEEDFIIKARNCEDETKYIKLRLTKLNGKEDLVN